MPNAHVDSCSEHIPPEVQFVVVFPEDGGSEEEVVVLLGESVTLPLVPTNVGEYVRNVPVPRKVGGYDTNVGRAGCEVGTDTFEDGFDPASADATIDSLVGLRKKLMRPPTHMQQVNQR